MKIYKIQTIFVAILTVLAVGTVFRFLQIVFIPLVVASLLSLMLTPLVNFMERIRIPRIIGIVMVMAALCIMFFAIGRIFYSSLQIFGEVFIVYQERLTNILEGPWQRFKIPYEFFPKFGWTRSVLDRIIQMSGTFVSFGAYLGLVLLFLIFMLAETPLSWRKFRRAFPQHLSLKLGIAVTDVSRQVARYLTLKTIISALTGLMVWGTLSIIGQDFATLWGMLAFLLNFIPSFGSLLIMAATMTLGLAQFYPEWNRISAVWISMPIIQILMGNIVDTTLQGDQLDLSPLVILVSLVLWGWMWGITGMFLAVPLTVALKMTLNHIENLKPFATLMGSGRMSRSFRQNWRREKKSSEKLQKTKK